MEAAVIAALITAGISAMTAGGTLILLALGFKFSHINLPDRCQLLCKFGVFIIGVIVFSTGIYLFWFGLARIPLPPKPDVRLEIPDGSDIVFKCNNQDDTSGCFSNSGKGKVVISIPLLFINYSGSKALVNQIETHFLMHATYGIIILPADRRLRVRIPADSDDTIEIVDFFSNTGFIWDPFIQNIAGGNNNSIRLSVLAKVSLNSQEINLNAICIVALNGSLINKAKALISTKQNDKYFSASCRSS